MGLAKIEKGVKENLVAMRAAKAATDGADAPGLGAAGENKLPPTTKKLHHLLKKMEVKVAQELADPELKNSPQVAVDVKMLATMKTAVKKSEALVLVAAIALKKAKTEKDKMKIKTVVKGAMHKVMEKLKTDVAELKEQAAAIAVQKKGVHGKKEAADSDVASAAAGEDAQTDESTSTKAETDDSATEKVDESEKAEDTAEKTDASEKEKDTDAKSGEDASAAYPEDGDKWIFKHQKPKAAKGATEEESSSAEDAKAAETPEKEEASTESFKPAQDDFMKKLKEDLLKLKKHFPSKSSAPVTA